LGGFLALACLPLEPTAFTFGKPTPDPETLVVLQRVLKALGADLTAPADPLGLPGGAALLREKRLRICLCAERHVLPAQAFNVFWTDDDLR